MNADTQERRHFTRVDFDAQTVIRIARQPYEVRLADISLKGLLVLTDATLPLRKGQSATIELQLGDVRLLIPGELAHHEEDHYGFRMKDLDLETITHLRRLVELNMGDASLFERELEHLLPTR